MVQIGNYDASQHDPNKALDPLPPGWYPMQIVASSVEKTQNGQGQYLKLEFEMIESAAPQLKGRKAWDRLNLWNQNAQAVDIANRTLSAICHATGVMQVQDTEALHHKPLAVKVKVRPAEGEYEPQNEVTGYDAFNARFPSGAMPNTPAGGPAAPGAAPPVSGPPKAPAVSKPPAPAVAPPPAQGGQPPWGGGAPQA